MRIKLLLFLLILLVIPVICSGGMIIQKFSSSVSVEYSDATEVWLFENNGDAENNSANNLTENDTPVYSSSDYKEGSYSLDGDGTATLTLADDADFDIGTGTDVSWSFWVQFDNIASVASIGAKADSGNGWKFSTYWIDGSDYGLSILFENSWAGTAIETGVSLTTGTWYHVVVIHDVSDSNELTVYISETTFGDTINGTTLNADTDPVGTSSALILGDFDGHLDEFAMFNGTVLTAEQAEDIFDGTWQP